MPTYHYLNDDHSLVMRDNRVIFWTPHDEPQDEDERKRWIADGSPKPTPMQRTPFDQPARAASPPSLWPGFLPRPPPITPVPPDANERIDRAMQAAYEALPTAPPEQLQRMSENEERDYLVGISNALRAMIAGFRAIQPREQQPTQQPRVRRRDRK